MNLINHVLFASVLCAIFVQPKNISEITEILFISFLINYLIDQDHKLNKKAKWYFKRTWIQEPFSILLIAFPAYLLVSVFNKFFAACLLITWIAHIIADYLCVFPAKPLAPFNNKIIKPEGYGIFYPDTLIFSSENEIKWKARIKRKRIKAISENWFTAFLILLVLMKILVNS